VCKLLCRKELSGILNGRDRLSAGIQPAAASVPIVESDKPIRSRYMDAFERARPCGLVDSVLNAEC
jgi:hypothetical protein